MPTLTGRGKFFVLKGFEKLIKALETLQRKYRYTYTYKLWYNFKCSQIPTMTPGFKALKKRRVEEMTQLTSLILRQILPRQEAIWKPLETSGLWSGPQFLFPVLPWVCFQASGSLYERETSGCEAGLGDLVRGNKGRSHGSQMHVEAHTIAFYILRSLSPPVYSTDGSTDDSLEG